MKKQSVVLLTALILFGNKLNATLPVGATPVAKSRQSGWDLEEKRRESESGKFVSFQIVTEQDTVETEQDLGDVESEKSFIQSMMGLLDETFNSVFPGEETIPAVERVAFIKEQLFQAQAQTPLLNPSGSLVKVLKGIEFLKSKLYQARIDTRGRQKIAVETAYVEMLTKLLEKSTKAGKPQKITSEEAYIKILEKLFKKVINHKLLNAAKRGRAKMVRKLIRAGADINIRNKNGANVLHLAAFNGDEELVAFFREKGVSPTRKIPYGKYAGYTPLAIAQEKGHTQVVKVLELALS